MFRSLLFAALLSCLAGLSHGLGLPVNPGTSSPYVNVVTSQTPCSASCNGFATVTYACVDTTTGLPVASSLCPTPITTVNCNYCKSIFSFTDWTPCNSTCATPEFPVGGVQTRVPVCRVFTQVPSALNPNVFVDYTYTVSTTLDVDCGAPSTNGLTSYATQSRACNTAQCIGNTYIEQLVTASACAGECNQPGATYQQVCVNSNGTPIPASNCNGLLLAGWIQNGGTVVRQCPNYVPCATKQVLSQFSICSRPCNVGVQSRNLTCHQWNAASGTFSDYALSGVNAAAGASFVDSAGQPAQVDSICVAFTDVASLTRTCNTQKCNTPYVFQCGAWGLNYALYQRQAVRTCQCQDSTTGVVVADSLCINNFVDRPANATSDLASVGLYENSVVITAVSDCNAKCTIAGGVKPTRTLTYNCMNIDGSTPSGVTYAAWIFKHPECALPGASNFPATQGFPVTVTETCNTGVCTDVTWAITNTPACPVACGNTNQYITRTVQCMALGTGLPTNSSNCPSIAMPDTSVLCNTQACTFSWQATPWSTCSQPCVPQSYITSGAASNPLYSPPTQTRTITCISQDGVTIDASGNKCPNGPAIPVTTRRCNFFACQESLQVVYRSDCLTGNAKCITSATQTGTKFADCYDPFGNLIPTDVKGLPAKACRDLYPATDFTPNVGALTCKDYVPVCATQLLYPDFGDCSQKCTPRTRSSNGQYVLGTVGIRSRALPICIGPDGVTAVSLDQCTTVDALNAQGYRQANGALVTSIAPNSASDPTPQVPAFQSRVCNVDVCPDLVNWQVNQDAGGNCLSPTCVDAYGTQVNYKMCLDRVDTIGSAPTCPVVVPTYSWLYGIQPYSACSKQCGGGVQTRNILCTLADGVTLTKSQPTSAADDTNTDPTIGCGPLPTNPAIPTSRRCNVQPCNYAVKVVPQVGAICSASCGGGLIASIPTCVNTINGNSESLLSCVNTKLLSSGDCSGGLTIRADGSPDWNTCIINAPCNSQACNGVAGASNSYYQWVTNPWGACHCPASNLEQVSRTVSCYQFSSAIPAAYDPILDPSSSGCDANSKPIVTHNCPAKDIGCAGSITYQWRISFPDCKSLGCGASVSTLPYCAGFQMGQSTPVDDSLCASTGPKPASSSFTCSC